MKDIGKIFSNTNTVIGKKGDTNIQVTLITVPTGTYIIQSYLGIHEQTNVTNGQLASSYTLEGNVTFQNTVQSRTYNQGGGFVELLNEAIISCEGELKITLRGL